MTKDGILSLVSICWWARTLHKTLGFYTIMLISSPGWAPHWLSLGQFHISVWRQTAYKTKQCFLTRRLTDPLEKKGKKIYQSLGGVFSPPLFFHSPQSNYLPGTRTWTSSIWRTNPKRSHEVLNGRNRESGAQTPARWERGRKQRYSVQHRLKEREREKKEKTYRLTKPNLRCAISARKSTFFFGFEENK